MEVCEDPSGLGDSRLCPIIGLSLGDGADGVKFLDVGGFEDFEAGLLSRL